MDENESTLLSLRESFKIELKEAKNNVPSSFYETYSAFSNTRGGFIYLGIKENKAGDNELVGVDDPEEMQKVILATLANKEKCSANLLDDGDFSIIPTADGKKILRIEVKEAPSLYKPVYISGSINRSYKRRGDADIRLSEEEIIHFFSDRRSRPFDREINSIGAGVSSLDEKTISSYREYLAKAHGETDVSALDDLSLLKKIGAYRIDQDGNEGITNGAILFFGKLSDILTIFPFYFLDYQRYSDVSSERWEKRFTSDDFSFEGNLFTFYLRLRGEVKPFLPNPFYREGWTNLDGNDLYRAVLEGAVNAFSNASFSLHGHCLFRQTPTSFLFHNPGRLPVGVKQAVSGGDSEPRNPSILGFFRYIDAAESAGMGVPYIFKTAERYSYRAPSLYECEEREATELVISYKALPRDTPSYESKSKIIAYLSHKESGASIEEIAVSLGFSKTQTVANARELMAMGLLKDNGRKRKGRKVSLAY